VKKSLNEGFFLAHESILHQFCKNAMHFYIIDGTFYLGGWRNSALPAVPSSTVRFMH